MSEDNALVPATIRAVPTQGLEGAVEKYTRALSGATAPDGAGLDIAGQRIELTHEWKRVQAAVVYEMSWLGATQDRQLLACSSVVARVLDAADVRLRQEGLSVPRELVCEVLKQATPATPVEAP